jgi:hypothetical protein
MALSLPLLNFIPLCACLHFFIYDSHHHMPGELMFIYKLYLCMHIFVAHKNVFGIIFVCIVRCLLLIFLMQGVDELL